MPEADAHVIYGLRPVLEAMRGRSRIEAIYVSRSLRGATRKLRAEADRSGVRVIETSREELSRRVGHANHQGVVALLGGSVEPASRDVDDLLEYAKARGEPPLVLVLDHIQDPQNLGALIRSTFALGGHGVVIPKDRAARLTPAVIRASAGAALHLPVATVTNLKRALSELKDAGVWVAAAMLDGEPAYAARLDGPLALVIGSEEKGVSPSVAGDCDLRVSIPLSGGFDSLNASVAGGILLYEARRQRHARSIPVPLGRAR